MTTLTCMVATRRSAILAVCLAFALGLSGCSRESDAEPTSTPDDRFVVVTPTPGTPTPKTPTPLAGEERYVVQPGDSLSSIAAKFGTTQEALQEANGIEDPNSISVGQELIIPER
jgi:LysM repeat protein